MSNVIPIIKEAMDIQEVIDDIVNEKATSVVAIYIDKDNRIRATSSNFETTRLLGAIYLAAKHISEVSDEQ